MNEYTQTRARVDGLWDVMSSQDAVNFIHSKLDGNNLETLSGKRVLWIRVKSLSVYH